MRDGATCWAEWGELQRLKVVDGKWGVDDAGAELTQCATRGGFHERTGCPGCNGQTSRTSYNDTWWPLSVRAWTAFSRSLCLTIT